MKTISCPSRPFGSKPLMTIWSMTGVPTVMTGPHNCRGKCVHCQSRTGWNGPRRSRASRPSRCARRAPSRQASGYSEDSFPSIEEGSVSWRLLARRSLEPPPVHNILGKPCRLHQRKAGKASPRGLGFSQFSTWRGIGSTWVVDKPQPLDTAGTG